METPDDVGRRGVKDPDQFMHAIRSGRQILTRNAEDFELLHELVLLSGGHHPGVLAVRAERDPKRGMNTATICRALRNLGAAGVPFPDRYYVLNHWR